VETLKKLAAALQNLSPTTNLVFMESVTLKASHPILKLAQETPKSVHLFDLQLNPLGTLPFVPLEYRLTDVTSPDAEGRFWAINYFYPGDKGKLNPAADELTDLYPAGPTHAQSEVVERLVEFQYTPAGVVRTDTPPIQLQLLSGGDARNWEGIVRLDERGFLLVTDKYPQTILAFVPLP